MVIILYDIQELYEINIFECTLTAYNSSRYILQNSFRILQKIRISTNSTNE
jgi:hypothetical protein